MIFDRTLSHIERNKQIKEEGGFNCIPFGFPRFENYLPGIMKSRMYTITASSGVGKSKFARQKFVVDPFDFIMNNPESGMDMKVFYFAMEESAENFISSVIVNKLYQYYGIRVDVNTLMSVGRGTVLPEEVIDKIKEIRGYFEPLEDKVEVIEGSINPFGIYSKVRNYHEERGKYHYKSVMFDKEDGSQEEKRIVDYYEPYNPNEYVFCIADHISLLSLEKGLTNIHDAIQKLSSDYFTALKNRFGTVIVNVQQQAAESEKKQFTAGGKSIDEKLEPDFSGLAENKKTYRDSSVALGLFAPSKHDIEEHAGYDIRRLRDRYRSLSIIKNSDGEDGKRIGLYFDGATNYFKELPKSSDTKGLEKAYKFAEKESKREINEH